MQKFGLFRGFSSKWGDLIKKVINRRGGQKSKNFNKKP